MKRSVLLWIATLGIASVPVAAVPFTNGNFDNPGTNTVFFQIGQSDTYVPGWVHSGTGYDSYSYGASYSVPAQSDDFFITFGHSGYTGGILSQTFDTIAGHQYSVTYYVRLQQGGGANPDQQLALDALDSGSNLLNGIVYTFNNDQNWAAGTSLAFTATGSTSTIRFTDQTTSSNSGPVNWDLDTVSVTDTTSQSATPEPGSFALFGGALSALVAIRRRK